MEKISIIVPVYNEEKHLDQCVCSIRAQSYENIEIILVDDGSQRSCASMCDEYAKRDSRIKVIHKENGGSLSARKTGIKTATGKYIGFVDADDWIEPKLYEAYSEMLSQSPDIIAAVNYYRDYENGDFDEVYHSVMRGVWKQNSIETEILAKFLNASEFYDSEFPISMCFYLFKTELLKELVNEWNDRIVLAETAAILFQTFFHIKTFSSITYRGYHYRCNRASKTFRKIENIKEKYKYTYDWINEQIEKSKYDHWVLKEKNDMLAYIFFMNTDNSFVLKVSDEHLHPYSKVKRGSRIIIYGMGQRGQKLVESLQGHTDYTIVGLSDKNYESIAQGQYSIIRPSDIEKYDYDYLVLTIAKKTIRNEIIEELTQFGVPREKIAEPDISVINAQLLLGD